LALVRSAAVPRYRLPALRSIPEAQSARDITTSPTVTVPSWPASSSLVSETASIQKYSGNEQIPDDIQFTLILTVNNNTFCFATIDKVFYCVASVFMTCFGPYIRP
jgi:hypothetical protein